MKKCPYCAEEIQDEAIVCKHCGRDLIKPVAPPQISPPPKKQNKASALIMIFLILCCLILAIGRFAGSSSEPTPTAVLSIAVTPTGTNIPTQTIAPTKTATKPPTNTLEPLTATARAQSGQETKVAAKTASAGRVLAANGTSTAEAKAAATAMIAQYSTIDLRELLTYPDDHKGEKVVIRGQIFNINGNVVQIYVGSFDAIYVEMDEAVSGIYEDDYITVYGTVYGSYCFDNSLGNQVCQPGIYDAFYVKG